VRMENRDDGPEPDDRDVGRKQRDEWDKGYYARSADLCDAFALGDISRDEFIRRLEELRVDFHEAHWMANQIQRGTAE
jgi:hypothetical protein